MELHHLFTVPAPVDTTWETFMDLAGVASCFPGATVTSVDGDSFTGTVKVKLGPIALLYAGSGTFVERDDGAHRAVLEAKGKDKRGNGTAGATVTIALTETADSGTSVDVQTDLSVTGKPAQFGRGVMQDVSDKLLGQFVACLEQRFDEPAPQDSAAAPAAVPAETDEVVEASTVASTPNNGRVAAPARATPPMQVSTPGGADDALDLGATVLPVILRSYAPQLIAAAVGVVVGILIGRGLRP